MTTPSNLQDEVCPDCGVVLPQLSESGAAHRYVGASPSCWQLFSYLLNAGEPPVAPGQLNPLLLDAYCVQHHGTPSPQAVNSVAVHALALHGVLVAGVAPENALWIRQQALRDSADKGKHGRFYWLEPPELGKMLTVADIVNAPTPAARSEQLQAYVQSVWQAWSNRHGTTLAQWYAQYVA
ncbi:MAG: hypothetical protein CL608_07830 [Anaerolineaceae bacterium]|nr:hypothetical protein [Anaerolineaceae bacterium]